ncbi:hypothetical protein QMA56_02820 [Leuconostoc falkenbergense]|uniref:lipocalin-like domain-containing protein n=1 Tax=Leuconostoc falkenbergense TaxID=2766470 RepID=UPI0024AE4798|nr:hypothetical protein [Leuconostoc falkenbergense]MDI6666638.1 hypothetical protein [Leuconostoc falkenbergense]
MKSIRIMDRAEDYEKLGIDPNNVQTWEDGRRDSSEPFHNEVWYFDAILDQGSKFVLGLRPKNPMKMLSDKDSPNLNIMITTPDGETKQDFLYYTAEESYIGMEKADLKFGPHTVVGDFKTYDIHIEPVNGVGCDLHYEALVEPFRQGNSAVISLGNNDEHYYTDLNVPKSKVTGTLYYDGEKHVVSGLGYHDHQWMNINPLKAWHHWLWGHLYTDKYTVMIYDFVAQESYGFKRIPFFGIQDNSTGKTIYMTDGNVEHSSETFKNSTGKAFPKKSFYRFQNKEDSKIVEFTIEWQKEIETRNMYKDADMKQKIAFKALNIQPVYMRYYGIGVLTIKENGHVNTTKGDMIYEYNYAGKEDPRADV